MSYQSNGQSQGFSQDLNQIFAQVNYLMAQAKNTISNPETAVLITDCSNGQL